MSRREKSKYQVSEKRPREVKKNVQKQPQPQLLSVEEPAKPVRDFLFYIGIFLFAFALYANTFNHGWVLDDYGAYKLNIYVTKGVDGFGDIMTKTYRHGSGFYTDNLYRPLSQLMFAIEWQLSPDNPGFSHMVSVIFHALTMVLLFVLLRKLFRNRNWLLPLFITLLYASHPMHTEVVANIKSRDDIMCLFFLVLTAIFMLRYVDNKQLWRKIGDVFVVFFFFLCAFFSKESSITMLAALPLMLYFFRKPKLADVAVLFVVLLIPAAIYLKVRADILLNYPTSKMFTVSIMDHYYYDLWDTNIFSYWATAIMLMGKYLILLFVPYQQVCDYSFSQLPVMTFANWQVWLSLLVHVALVVYAILGIKKKNPVAYGIFFYICAMSIYSNIVMRIGSSFADRFLFIPSLGYCIAIVCAVADLLKINTDRLSRVRGKLQYTFIAIFGAVVIVFSGCTIKRAAEWVDQFTLFGADVKKSDNSAHMRLYWGLALRDKAFEARDKNDGENDWNKVNANNQEFTNWMWQAIEQFKTGLNIYPKSADCSEQLGIAYDNIYMFYPNEHYRDTAEKYYLRSLEIVPSKAATNSNIAKIYFDKGQILKAKEYYLNAIRYDPLFADAYFNLGSCFGMLAKYDSSFYFYRTCLEFQPDRADCYTYMGLNYANLRQYDSSIVMYDHALALNKYLHNAYILKAKTYITMQQWDNALKATDDALEANPFNGEAFFVKALIARQHEQDLDKALDYLRECNRLQPLYAEAFLEKGRIFERRGQLDSAHANYDKAFQISPHLFQPAQ